MGLDISESLLNCFVLTAADCESVLMHANGSSGSLISNLDLLMVLAVHEAIWGHTAHTGGNITGILACLKLQRCPLSYPQNLRARITITHWQQKLIFASCSVALHGYYGLS